MLGVEIALWPIASKEAGKRFRRVLEASKRFMVRWHEDETKSSRKRHASVMGGVQVNGEGEGQQS